ncbi:MAG: thiamine biosynthesis protein [Candidatus Eisenbacteria bacterium]|nr:thiamine biosynthesis protein [Candidatus Eisenbacteria bacterium]
MSTEPIRAIALFSGGLDSILAARIVRDQGIDVIAVHFDIGVCPGPGTRRVLDPEAPEEEPAAVAAGRRIGLAVETVDLYPAYWETLVRPRHGYGSGFNPCLDCKVHMLRAAAGLMREREARFVITGEVIGQRPMSQQRNAMRMIEKESGLDGLLLRPLSARLLDPTLPEREGWVDRERLLEIAGRGRKEQMALAERLEIGEYPSPAGGCCLTEPVFAARMRDYLEHRGEEEAPDLREIHLLQLGRHFRLSPRSRAVVARDSGECRLLDRNADLGWRLEAEARGPVTLALDGPGDSDLLLAAAITAGYGDGRNDPRVPVRITRGEREWGVDAAPLSKEEAARLRIG